MFRATLWLIQLLFLLHNGHAQSQTKLGCPKGCICQDLSATNPQYKVECQSFPDSQLPARTTEFKSRNCPVNLTVDTFNRLRPFLVSKLDLSKGNILNIGDSALAVFTKAVFIDLSYNRIQNIGTDMLKGCNRLEELRMSNNLISTLGNNCFTSLFNVKIILLDHNTITEFPALPKNLENFDISFNDVKSIKKKEMASLQSLNLCGNPLDEVLDLTFGLLSTICIPRFSGFDFNNVPIQTVHLDYYPGHDSAIDLRGLQQMPQLKNFTIDGFHVTSFIWPNGVGHKVVALALNHVTLSEKAETEFLENLPPTSIQSLDLSNSPGPAGVILKNHDIWEKLQDLEYLDMRACNLTSLGELRTSANQIMIDVSENPLLCDCPLANSLKIGTNVRLVGNEAECAAPEKFKGRTLPNVLPYLCQQDENNQVPGQSDSKTSVKTKELEPEAALTPVEPVEEASVDDPSQGEPFEVPMGSSPAEQPEELTPAATPETDEMTMSETQPEPEPETTEEFASEPTTEEVTKPTRPPTPEEDEAAAFGHNDHTPDQTTYIIVGVVLALAFFGAIIFSVLFFYFRRRGHAGIETGNAQYKKHTSSRDNLVKGPKK